MRLPKGAASDGAITLPNINVSTATLEAVNANSLKSYLESAGSGSGKAVLYTAQTLTTEQKLQACTNLGIGDPDTDFLTYYNNA